MFRPMFSFEDVEVLLVFLGAFGICEHAHEEEMSTPLKPGLVIMRQEQLIESWKTATPLKAPYH